jgi:23S rRNA G2069 N7-methylase RlmK/C1962 C5-methylase RlmI
LDSAGLLALLASLRGAQVAAVDASAALLAIARERLPAVNSIFYENVFLWFVGGRP